MFSPDSTLSDKIIAYIFMALLACSLVGIFTDVLLDEWLVVKLQWLAAILSLTIVIWMVGALYHKGSRVQRRIEAQGMRRWKVLFGIVIGLPMIIFMAVCRGVPASVHLLLPADDRAVVLTIDHRNSDYSSKGCRGGVFVKEYHSIMNDEVCGLQRSDWRDVDAGEKIMLFGKRTLIGFSYDRYRLASRH